MTDITSAEHRFAMVSAAIAGDSSFEASNIEMRFNCPTYAGDTIRAFKELYGKDIEIYFITGLDAVLTIINWDKSKTYPGLCQFIAATRPGYQKEFPMISVHILQLLKNRPYQYLLQKYGIE